MSATETTTDLREPPRVSGDDGGPGHLEELRRDPIGLMERVRAECGHVGALRLADRDAVLLPGPKANELLFRAPEAEPDPAEAYPCVTPTLEQGLVLDTPPRDRPR